MLSPSNGDGSQLEIKFKTDAEGLKLGLRSKLLRTTPCYTRNHKIRVFRHACRRSSQTGNGSSGAESAQHAHYGSQDRSLASSCVKVGDARGRSDDLHDWIRNNLVADLSVLRLAEWLGSARAILLVSIFARTGENPGRAVERLRTEAARRLLQAANEPIKVVARRTGFGDDKRMRPRIR